MHASLRPQHRTAAQARSAEIMTMDRPALIKHTKAELETARGEAGAAKSRLDNAWKDLNATRRSAGISQAEYQLKQSTGDEATRLRGKLADKEQTYKPIIDNHHDKIRAAEADVATADSKVRTLEAKVLRLESGGPMVDKKPVGGVPNPPTPVAAHGSILRPSGAETRTSPLSHVPAQNSGVFLEDLVPTAGIPFQLPNPLDRPGSHANTTNAHKINIKPEGAE